MIYRANIYPTGKFGHVLTVLFLLGVGGLFYMREYRAALILIFVVLSIIARLYNRKTSFADHAFRYDGWIRTIEVPYSEIIKVENSGSLGYPLDRFHGPLEYRITTKDRKFWISLLWFNGEAAREFRERIVRRK